MGNILSPTAQIRNTRSLKESPTLLNAFVTNTHPQQTQDEQGNGEFIMSDWRRAWFTYGQCDRSITPEEYDRIKNSKDGFIVDPFTGEAKYEVDEIDGKVPDDLVGVLYRIGPGKFGVDGQRVAHILDADGLVLRFEFGGQKGIKFTSRFVETEGLVEEREAKQEDINGIISFLALTFTQSTLSPTKCPGSAIWCHEHGHGEGIGSITANFFQL